MVARDDHEPVLSLAREGPERLEIRAVGLHDDVRQRPHLLHGAAPVLVPLRAGEIRVLPHLEEVAGDDERRLSRPTAGKSPSGTLAALSSNGNLRWDPNPPKAAFRR